MHNPNPNHYLSASPYGMQMPERNGTSGDSYRYGYNGMEMDDEVSDNGNSYTSEFRQYDPRLGRWKSLDPLTAKYPSMSPYVAFNNNPIYYTDPLGLEGGPASNPGDRALNEAINNGTGSKDLAGTDGEIMGVSFVFADVREDENGNAINEEYSNAYQIAQKAEITLDELYEYNPNLCDNLTKIGQGQLIFTSDPGEAANNVKTAFSEGLSNLNDAFDDFMESAAVKLDKLLENATPTPNLELNLNAASSGASRGLGFGWQYLNIKVGNGWWESGKSISMNDFGLSAGTNGGGWDIEYLTIGGGILNINKDYWSKNKTYSLTELFQGSFISFSGGGAGYKGTKVTISTVSGEEIASGWLHQFSYSVGFGGSKSEFEIPNQNMTKEDSIKAAKSGAAGEFYKFLKKNQ